MTSIWLIVQRAQTAQVRVRDRCHRSPASDSEIGKATRWF